MILLVYGFVFGALLLVTGYLLGILRARYQIRTNYTRKILHFVTFFSPGIFFTIYTVPWTFEAFATIGITFLLLSLLFLEPIRTKVPILAIAFSSFDRPEDQPHTLKLLITEIVATYLVQFILFFYFLNTFGHTYHLLLVIFIIGLADGLAEVIGVRFGRHRFRVFSFDNAQIHHRSFEGSAAFFLATAFLVIVFADAFSSHQVIYAYIGIPLVLMFTEAIAPHTWDTPFLLGVYGIAVYILTYV